MRVVFLGTPETAVPSLEALLAAGHEVPLVVTQPDRPVGRSRQPQPPAVKVAAAHHGLPALQPLKVRDGTLRDAIAAARPDVLAVVAYGRILPGPVLRAAVHGAVNLHFSLLPALRGAAPVPWALARGLTETGITTFRLDEGLDTGDLLLQERVAIEGGEHAPALLGRLASAGARLLVETLAGLASGSIVPRPQDHAAATTAPPLARPDGWWDPAWTASELEGRVRGFDPWPGVWAVGGSRRLRIVEARALAGAFDGAAPGSVTALEGDAARVACAKGTVVLVSVVQPEGGRAMTARAAAHGRLLRPGDVLVRVQPTT